MAHFQLDAAPESLLTEHEWKTISRRLKGRNSPIRHADPNRPRTKALSRALLATFASLFTSSGVQTSLGRSPFFFFLRFIQLTSSGYGASLSSAGIRWRFLSHRQNFLMAILYIGAHN